ncbi:hypothetical protein KAR91_84185 [Candidatus Pacearchaeota archaeon]|nr:hypothetical protein [Candidatus Pacearchaeota archaeon]
MKISHEQVTALLSYYENALFDQQAKNLFPKAEVYYQNKWSDRLKKGLIWAWGKMDYDTRRQYCVNAEEWHRKKEEG